MTSAALRLVVFGVALGLCALGAGPLRPAPPAWAASAAPVWAEHGMVVTSQADASRAGLEMLEAGGNAVDAAVAAAFALSVTQPFSSGLGGGAFLLVRLADGTAVAVDCRETAPAAADRDMYVRPGVPERRLTAKAPSPSRHRDSSPGSPCRPSSATARLPLAAGDRPPQSRLAEEGFAIGPRSRSSFSATCVRSG